MTPQMPKVPQMVGSYRIVSQLGQGGMARALLAIRQGPGRFRKLFVVKQLRLDFCDDPNFVAMFLDEARLAALLNHPNVVQTHETGEDLHSRFISMEYLEGQSLGRVWGRANKTKSMSLELSIRVIAEALSGLHYAHQLTDLNGEALSVVHRDVSPGNIFVTYDGQVKLLDFGIAKASGGFSQADDGALKGKLSYMAPEQAMTKAIDCRADIFAVGVILWEAIAGRRMVPRKQEDATTINNRVHGRDPSIDTVCPDAPEGIRAICRKAMALDPADRYASAKELRSALLKYLSSIQQSPSADELATLVCDLFSKERAAIAASIAETISADDPITLDPAVLDAWNTYTGDNPIHTPSPDGDLEIEIVADESTILDTESGRLDISSPAKTSPTNLNTHGDIPRAENENSSNKKLLFFGSLAAAAAVVGTLLVVGNGDGTSAKTAAVVPETVDGSDSIVPGTVIPDKGEVQIVVSASPSSAIIELDGVIVANPYVGAQSKDAEHHNIAVSVEGYLSQSKTVSFAQAGEWKFALDKDPDFALATDGTDEADTSRPGTKSGSERRRNGRRDRATADRTATRTIAAKVENDPEPQPAKKSVGKEETTKQDRRPQMGDDLGESKSKQDTKVKIDRNNPYQ